MKLLIWLGLGVLVGVGVGWGQPPAKREFYGRRLEPEASVVLHGAGQSDESSFAAYRKAVAPAKPMLSMSYVDLHDDIGAYFVRIRAEMMRYSDYLVPQIGLSMNGGTAGGHYEGAVGRGDEDARVAALCAGLKGLGRPVFLRIGYEFNGAWNGYRAADYVAAFRRVARAIRAAGLENVALVWDWSADAELDAEHGGANWADAGRRYGAFYPGDDVVDWWGVNLFSEESLGAGATKAFLAEARGHREPVMIGESAPRGWPVSRGAGAVEHWYKPYFGLIEREAGVKAFCYIDWDWRRYAQWADWGDSRVEDDAEVLGFYKGKVGGMLYAGARGRVETLRLLRVR